MKEKSLLKQPDLVKIVDINKTVCKLFYFKKMRIFTNKNGVENIYKLNILLILNFIKFLFSSKMRQS